MKKLMLLFLLFVAQVTTFAQYQWDEWHWAGNTFAATKAVDKNVQNFIEQMRVEGDGTCYTSSGWDENGRTHGVYKDGDVIGNENHGITGGEVYVNSTRWWIQDYGSDPKRNYFSGTSVTNGSKTLSGIVKPTALGLDRINNWLMVADDGAGEHQVKFFDDAGNLKKTFGVKGGIFSGVPGEVKPDKLWGLSGCGTDNNGNIYVAQSLAGSAIRCYNPDGSPKWEVWDLIFSDMGDFKTNTDGTVVYGPDEIFDMDYSQENMDGMQRSHEWKLRAYTVNYDKFPDDPRAVKGNAAYIGAKCIWYREVNGRPFILGTDMSIATGIRTYKFNTETDGYIAIPSTYLSIGEPGFDIDKNANIWKWGYNKITRYNCLGYNSNGDLQYDGGTDIAYPAPFNSVMGGFYDPDNDVMYLGGGTAAHPTEGWGHPGPVLARYDNWSSSRTKKWEITIPWYHNEDPDVGKRIVPSYFQVLDDKLYIAYGNSDGDNTPAGQSGPIRIYNSTNGNYIDRWLAPPENGSWIDMQDGGIKVIKTSNGDILLMREENWKAKLLIFRKRANGSPTTCTTLRNADNPSNAIAGLNYKYYEGTWDNLPNFDNLTAVKTGTTAGFDLSIRNRDDNFGLVFTGYINVPTDGEYTFYTTSDDGSKLYIGSNEVVSNDGLHGLQENSGKICLKAGKHSIKVTFFENSGGEALEVRYEGPAISKKLVPNSELYRVSNTIAVTGVSLNAPSLNLTIGGTSNLTATISPTNATNKTISWASNASTVASVDASGKVTANATGNATITVTTADGSKTATCAVAVSASPGAGNGDGLTASYYNTIDLSGSIAVTRTDPTINFDWGTGSYSSGQNADNFSARWTGQVQPKYTETYTFETEGDDGVRLWVNGTQLINNWVDQAPAKKTGTISLTAGSKYDIKMEYYENGGGAVARLSWSSASQVYEIIPKSQLYSVTTPTCADEQDTVTCYKTNSTITIDGNPNEAAWCVNNTLTKIGFGTMNNTVRYGVLYNNTNLYIAAKVQDADLYGGQTDIWENDGIEIYIDPNNSGSATYDANDRQYIRAYNNSTVWASAGGVSGIQSAQSAISGGYAMEIAIPWSLIGFSSVPAANTIIGFDIANDDNDDNTARNVQIVWNGDGNNYANTSKWGDLKISSTLKSQEMLTSAGDALTNGISIYPNPVTSNQLHISRSADTPATIAIYRITGQLVFSQLLNSANETILTDNFGKGLFIVKIGNGSQTGNFKIVIQ